MNTRKIFNDWVFSTLSGIRGIKIGRLNPQGIYPFILFDVENIRRLKYGCGCASAAEAQITVTVSDINSGFDTVDCALTQIENLFLNAAGEIFETCRIEYAEKVSSADSVSEKDGKYLCEGKIVFKTVISGL